MIEIDFYIVSGQSNSGAASLNNGLDPYPSGNTQYLGSLNNAYIHNKYIDSVIYTDKIPRFKNIYLGRNTGILQSGAGDECKTYFGCEVSFAYDIRPVYIMKYGLNNTPIAGFITANGAAHNFKRAVYQAMNQAYIAGYSLNLKGFIFLHGESDALSEVNSDPYEANLGILFDNFETYYTAACTSLGFTNRVATYKKIIFECKVAATYIATVEAAKISFVASRGNSIYWQVDNYDLRYDALHYTAAAYLQMGLDLSEYFKNNNLPVWFD